MPSKRILVSILIVYFAIISFYPTHLLAQEASQDNKPSKTLVYYNSWPGDHENPLFKNIKMSPKKSINLLQFKEPDSQILKTILPGEFLVLITADYNTYPSDSPVMVLQERNGLKPGDTIYLMGYIGGGTCLAWYKNNVFNIPAEGIEGVKYYNEQRSDVPTWARLNGQLPPRPDLWLYVKTIDNLYGWIKYDSYQDWQLFGHSIFIY